jgi:hypothetical protein
MDITFRTGAVHGVSLREVGAIDRCRKVPLGGHHYDAAKCKEFRRTRQPSADCKVKRDPPVGLQVAAITTMDSASWQIGAAVAFGSSPETAMISPTASRDDRDRGVARQVLRHRQ